MALQLRPLFISSPAAAALIQDHPPAPLCHLFHNLPLHLTAEIDVFSRVTLGFKVCFLVISSASCLLLQLE